MKTQVLSITITRDDILGHAFSIRKDRQKITSSFCFPDADTALEGAMLFINHKHLQKETVSEQRKETRNSGKAS